MEETNRQFILVTSDYSGLGFAIQEQEQNGSDVLIGYKSKDEIDEEEQEAYDIQGEGMVEKYDLDYLMENRDKLRDYYWIWDGNHNYEEAEILRKEGFKIFGGHEFSYDLENDREFGIQFSEECGLFSPEQQEFSSVEEGISFLEEHEDESYVYKPNDQDSAYTTVPTTEEEQSANIEIRQLIKALGFTDYILQKRVKGVEVNIESWYYEGNPLVTFANLENKKLHNGDKGSACGCAFDVCWQIDNKSLLAQKTVRKYDQKMQEMRYTGFMDCNVILADFDQVYFIEFCGRMGYNAHPNLFTNISYNTALSTLADLIDGNLEDKFKKGFGASVSMFNDHFKQGLPIYIPDNLKSKFHLFDGYKEDDVLMMGGFSKEIGIICAHNYTIPTAMQEAMNSADRIKFSNAYYRTDADSSNIPQSLVRRYEAIQAMGLI